MHDISLVHINQVETKDMKPIDAEFNISGNDSNITFKLLLSNGSLNSLYIKIKDEDTVGILLTDADLDSLENAFYAMYMLIRNSKD